ncbi:M42 family metallopeptidase [Halobacillus amylolyticus]|uniref:M42 family metallopeptidase n=1 Tax=Halobacillus amylolyticus TaxID=2932259 RepID=A0ABY4HD28_9BACI|nr:M42 family metallopeptidase [Halobacillus amylolyticus]UOR12313.1 M42 family metallopeptidase [Halobacillus amylolyticus]
MQKNNNYIVDHLKQLTSIPSPSGYTKEIMKYCENVLRVKGVNTYMTKKGALIATIKGANEEKQRMLTAHLDTLGAMVKEIKPNGKLKLSMIGGFMWNSVEGEYCTIHSNNVDYSGTILMEQASVHVYRNAKEEKRDDTNIEVRIDEQVENREDVLQLGIQVGDFVSFAPRFEHLDSGYIKSRHLDDKASAAILLHMLEELIEEQIQLPYTTHFFFSNNEEIGYGANASIPEAVEEYVAVDMGAIGDGQASTEYDVSICAKDSSGPYHLELKNQMVRLAEENKLGYKIDIYPFYGSDASAAIRAGFDIKHGLVGPGIDASHSFERTHSDSLIHTFRLLMSYIQSSMI